MRFKSTARRQTGDLVLRKEEEVYVITRVWTVTMISFCDCKPVTQTSIAMFIMPLFLILNIAEHHSPRLDKTTKVFVNFP